MAGCLLAHPSCLLEPIALHTQLDFVPEDPDCLYLHDLAISPEAKGLGTAKSLVQSFLHCFHESPYAVACLIAVQNSQSFWQKQGFLPFDAPPQWNAKLQSYGEGACYMIYRKQGAESSPT